MGFRIFTILAVIALGVSTWYLSSPSRNPRNSGSGPADQLPVLSDFDPDGNVSIRLHADRIDQIDHSEEVALVNVRVDYQSPQGQAWVLLGDTGRVEAGGKIIDVAGNVRLEEQSAEHAGTAVLHTDTLRYSVPDSIATTQSDVRIDFGVHTLTAKGLWANLKERTMRLESKVNGRFQP
jgi:LPS export ABC transporter protein LptC